MPPELTYLVYAAVLLVVHMLIQATLSDLSKGLGWALGAQDEPRTQNVVAGRVERALRNYVYNLPAFIILAVCLHLGVLGTETTALGAAVWFWARIAYIPAFASGVVLVRSIAWFVSLAGLLLMLLPFLG